MNKQLMYDELFSILRKGENKFKGDATAKKIHKILISRVYKRIKLA